MGKLTRITGIIILALFAIIAVVSFLTEDQSRKYENPDKQTIQYERSKDFSVIKVVNIIDTFKAVDAFGHNLKANTWYVQSNVTRSAFPINTKSTNCTELERLMVNGKKEMARVKITNGDPLGFFVEAEILLLGDKCLVLNDLEQYQIVSVK